MELLEKLEADYLKATGKIPVITISVEDDELIPGCPAQVGPDDDIKVSKDLGERDLTEAKAHEMGHIMLRHRGLVAFEIADRDLAEQACGDAANQLCTDINGAISHRFLLPLLKAEYGIDSILQRSLRCSTQQTIAKVLSEFPGHTTLSHIEGIVMYDVVQCGFMGQEQAEHILELDTHIRNAFDLSMEHLSQIHIGMPIEDQIKRCVDYVDKLGYPPKMFKIKEPPTVKAEYHALLNVDLSNPAGTDHDSWMADVLRSIEKNKPNKRNS